MTEEDHKDYIREKGQFFLSANHNEFTDFEYAYLSKYGNWCQGLESGELKPLNQFQEDFVEFFKNWKSASSPKNEKFLIWHKYKLRKFLSKDSNIIYVDPTEAFHKRDQSINIYTDFDYDRESLGRFSY